MQLVLPKDFIDPPYMLPEQQESAGGVTNFKEVLFDLEKEILKELFGYDMYSQFMEGLDTSGTVEQKWVDLKNGTEYTRDSKRYEWVGMKKMLIPAVASRYVHLTYRRMHQNGVVINNGQQNTQIVVPIYEKVTWWNDYVRIAGSDCETRNTLAGFLQANESDYPDFVFCSPARQNQLDF